MAAPTLPRSVRWRLQLGLLNDPDHDHHGNKTYNDNSNNDNGGTLRNNSWLSRIEDTNALKLRLHRSRYDQLWQRCYLTNSAVGIAMQGEDPLSALLSRDGHNQDQQASEVRDRKDSHSDISHSKGTKSKLSFGFKAATSKQRKGKLTSVTSISNNNNNSNNHEGRLIPQNEIFPTEEPNTASRWAEFYSVREMLDVIEKDLNRLPADHSNVFHEWNRRSATWKIERDTEEANRQRRVLTGEHYDFDEKKEWSHNCTESQQSNHLEQSPQGVTRLHLPSSSLSCKDGYVTNKCDDESNSSRSNAAADGSTHKWNFAKRGKQKDQNRPGRVAKNVLDIRQEERSIASAVTTSERKLTIRERADKLLQILFLYAREHPEIGYRQGMHEILSYVLLALEIDLLEEATILEKKRWRTDWLSPMGMDDAINVNNVGGKAGVDSCGNVVVIRLLDANYLVHDAFTIFECIMMALAPAYDAVCICDDTTTSFSDAEEENADQVESPMESMTSAIVSKIRYVARDEELFSHVLYMPVPPQLYFAKWIRLMFGREVAGGMDNVMRLWDAFFDLASATASNVDTDLDTAGTTFPLALMNVLKTAAASMILLIRHKLLAPTIARDGTMTGEPDPNEGIGYLMNYPPLEDIEMLVQTMTSLLAKESELSKHYSKQRVNVHDTSNSSDATRGILDHPLQMDEGSKMQRGFISCQRSDTSPIQKLSPIHDVDPYVCSPDAPLKAPLATTHTTTNSLHLHHPNLSEFTGNAASRLFEFGSKTVDAAIATFQRQHEVARTVAFDHPLQGSSVLSKKTPSSDDPFHILGLSSKVVEKTAAVDGSGTKPQDDYPFSSVTYRPSLDGEISESINSREMTNETMNNSTKSSYHCVQHHPSTEVRPNSGDNTSLEDSTNYSNAISDRTYFDRVRRLETGISPPLTKDHVRRKDHKDLAATLEKSVTTIMKHFNDMMNRNTVNGHVAHEEISSIVLEPPNSGDGHPPTSVNRDHYVNQNSLIMPHSIWDALADIDQVRRDLLSQSYMK